MPIGYDTPPNELAVELEEVRADATVLASVFDQLNAPLPESFPKQAVIDIASGLRQLPDGTARGCLRPLNEAQAQLAAIRSQHIEHEASFQPNQETPPLFRGEPVDQRLRALMSSVSTALQTANRLAADEQEPEAPEAGIVPPADTPAKGLIEKTVQTQKELEAERRDLDALKMPDSAHADSLRRRLTDALILNWLGRGELRMRRIVSARLQRIGDALREYPALLQRSADLISKGADVADYAYDKWHVLKKRIFEAGTVTIREVADDIANYARRLEAKRRRIDIAPPPTEPPADFNLERAATMIHRGVALPPAWKPFIEMLPLRNRRLRSLAGLEGLTSLRTFGHASVKAHDLTPLSGLSSLQQLNLFGTQVRDLGPLSGLRSLQRLDLNENSN